MSGIICAPPLHIDLRSVLPWMSEGTGNERGRIQFRKQHFELKGLGDDKAKEDRRV